MTNSKEDKIASGFAKLFTLSVSAPDKSGGFQIALDGVPVVQGAAHFNDPSEADLRKACKALKMPKPVLNNMTESLSHQANALIEIVLDSALLGAPVASWKLCNR